jgi:hypothetical protein
MTLLYVGALVFGALLVLYGLGVRPRLATIRTSAGQIVIEVGQDKEYLLVVHPQGWQHTPVKIADGDSLTIDATGRVMLDLFGLWNLANRMHQIELHQTTLHPDVKNNGAPKAPEDYVDVRKEGLDSDNIDHLWLDPNGDTRNGPRYIDKDYPARTPSKIIETTPYGALIGSIGSNAPTQEPSPGTAFLIGEHLEKAADKSAPDAHRRQSAGAFCPRRRCPRHESGLDCLLHGNGLM